MRKVLFILIALTGSIGLKAQQDAQFSQNMFLNQTINPGAVGIKGMHCFDLVSRQQWFGFEGAPFTGLLSYNGPLSLLANSGVGATLVFDQIGFETSLAFKGSFSYHLDLGSKGGKLGIGLDLGILQKSLNPNWVAGNTTDPTLFSSPNTSISGSDMGFDLGFGLFYYQPNKVYFGISGLKLLPQSLNIGGTPTDIRSHMYITGGYNYQLNQEFDLKPSVLIKTDLASTQLDVNLTAEWNKKVWLGASYRIQDAIVANVGYNFKLSKNIPNPLKVGLAYDFTTSLLRNDAQYLEESPSAIINQQVGGVNRSVGSVELYLGYCFVVPPKPNFKKYVDPLFL